MRKAFNQSGSSPFNQSETSSQKKLVNPVAMLFRKLQKAGKIKNISQSRLTLITTLTKGRKRKTSEFEKTSGGNDKDLFKSHLPDEQAATLQNQSKFIVRVFDGDLSETKQEALKKFRDRQLYRKNPFSSNALNRKAASFQKQGHFRKNSDLSDSLAIGGDNHLDQSMTYDSSLNMINMESISKLKPYQDQEGLSRLHFQQDIIEETPKVNKFFALNDMRNTFNSSFSKAQHMDQEFDGNNPISRNLTGMQHHRFKSAVNTQQGNRMLAMKKQIFDNTQEKLINNKKFYRITHSSQNHRKLPSQINYQDLSNLPQEYRTFYNNKGNQGKKFLNGSQDMGSSFQNYMREQSDNRNMLIANKKALSKLEKKCTLTLDEFQEQEDRKQTYLSELQTPTDINDDEIVRVELEKEIKANQIYRQTLQIKKLEEKHEKRMKEFKEQKKQDIQLKEFQEHLKNSPKGLKNLKQMKTLQEVSIKLASNNQTLNYDDIKHINLQHEKQPTVERGSSLKAHSIEDQFYSSNIEIFAGGKNHKQLQNREIRRQELKEKINEFLQKRNLPPVRQLSPSPQNDGVHVRRKTIVLETKKGKIMYSEDSLKRLLNNDSLKYEKNMQSVIDEFMEFSSKSYYLISNRLKHVKVQI